MNELKIKRAEVLRYMGYRAEPDENTIRLLEEAKHVLHQAATPRSIYRVFKTEVSEKSVTVIGTGLVFESRSLAVRLSGCGECALLAATLGVAAERAIAAAGVLDLALSLALDCTATAMIESLCDSAEAVIKAEAKARGLHATARYSPGYGDFPLDVQRSFCAVLDTGRSIGLSVTPESILTPRKSVTAVIGLSGAPHGVKVKGCLGCDRRESCEYKQTGAEGKACKI